MVVPTIEFSEGDWQQVESTWGSSIEANLREKILDATKNMVATVVFETQAAPVSEAERVLRDIRSTATALRELVALPVASDGRLHARHLLLNIIDDDRLGHIGDTPFHDPVKQFSEIVSSLEIACDRALVELADPGYGVAGGDGWSIWIRRLDALVRDGKVAARRRKPSSTRSQFVSLITTLQHLLPRAFRRHQHSREALAKAIARALSR